MTKNFVSKVYDQFQYTYWYIVRYWWREKLWNWFRVRLWDRYHILRIHEPGYHDPRYELLEASLAVVGRYVNELRVNSFNEELEEASDLEVVQYYVDIVQERIESGDVVLEGSWLNHYIVLRNVVKWWEMVKDHSELDAWTREEVETIFDNYSEKEIQDYLTSDYVDDILNKIVELRQGMWT